jgi:hypothetical protein
VTRALAEKPCRRARTQELRGRRKPCARREETSAKSRARALKQRAPMNTTTSASDVPARVVSKPLAPSSSNDARWPVGLWILLGAITALAINIALVLYLASQMPS